MTEIRAAQSITSIARDIATPKTTAGPEAGAAGKLDFATIVAQMATEAADTMRVAETTSAAGIKGQVPLNEVVDKVLEAERTLNSAIAVRDKVVAAYLELSRMQI